MDRLTVAMPTRDECYWTPEDHPVTRAQRLRYSSSQGIGGYQVRMTTFRMVRVDGHWLVDAYNPVTVTDVVGD